MGEFKDGKGKIILEMKMDINGILLNLVVRDYLFEFI